MNICEAINGGRPFHHKDGFGAWLLVDGKMVHRDCVSDFENMDFIRNHCMPNTDKVYWFYPSDLQRTDWEFVR